MSVLIEHYTYKVGDSKEQKPLGNLQELINEVELMNGDVDAYKKSVAKNNFNSKLDKITKNILNVPDEDLTSLLGGQ
jgi:hypothetical protein